MANHLGKIVRINDDGSVPEGQSLRRQARRPPGNLFLWPSQFARLALRPGTADIWEHEHGPRGGDEVNILKPGANYGWPKITYGIDYDGSIISDKTALPGMEQPVVYWVPSIAPSGMAFYQGDKFPKWTGDLFVGALAKTHLRRLRLEGDKVVEQEQLLGDLDERIRDVRSGPDGYLYVVTDDSRNGRVLSAGTRRPRLSTVPKSLAPRKRGWPSRFWECLLRACRARARNGAGRAPGRTLRAKCRVQRRGGANAPWAAACRHSAPSRR